MCAMNVRSGMQNLAALRAAVFWRARKNLRGGVSKLVVQVSENVCPNSVQCPKILAAVRPKSVQSWVCPKVVQKFKMLCFAVLKGG